MTYNTKSWKDVSSGLSDAGVETTDINALQKRLEAMSADEQSKAVRRGLFSGMQSDSGDFPKRRDLFRAWHFLSSLIAKDNGVIPAVDTTRRAAYLNVANEIGKIQKEIKKRADEALGREDPKISQPAEVQPTPSVAPMVQSYVPPPEAVRKVLKVLEEHQKALKAAKAIRVQTLVTNAAHRFKVQRQENLKKLTDHKFDNLRTHWGEQRQDIVNHFLRVSDQILHNYVTMSTALKEAYEHFIDVVEDAQKAKQAKIDMIVTAFTALSKLPSPFGIIGDVGVLVAKQAHLDPVEKITRKKVVMIEPSGTSVFNSVSAKVKTLSERVDTFTRVGIDMNEIEKPTYFSSLLEKLIKDYLNHVWKSVDEALAEHYGSSSAEIDATLQKLLADSVPAVLKSPNLRDSSNQALRIGSFDVSDPMMNNHGGQKAAIDIVKDRLRVFGGSIRTELEDRLISFDFEKLNLTDMREAMELYLLGSFVLADYAKGNSYSNMSLEAPIVERLSQNNDWGILTAGGEHHKNRPRGRLVWKGKENHHRALVYFFRWFRERYHPFDLLCNVQHVPDAKKITAKAMQQDMHHYIDKLSEAIEATRSKSLFGSTWNWEAVNQKMHVTTP